MLSVVTSPLFYLFLTMAVYVFFAFLVKKFKTALFNPLLWTIIFVIGYILMIVAIDKGELSEEAIQSEVKNYQLSASIFDFMLAPLTVSLAIPLYINRHVIKENWLPILVATIVGVGSSLGTVYGLSKALSLDKDIMLALLPRGITTAIAKEISELLGVSQFTSLTVTVVALTGIVGAILGPLLIKLFRSKDDVTVGLSLGSASHVIGTSKAFEYSSRAGAIASVSIITNGLLTVIVALIIFFVMK